MDAPDVGFGLEVESLVHRYGRRGRGNRAAALDGVGFRTAAPVVGLVGPNGAGKTTLLRCLAGFLRPTAGRIRLAGLDPERYRRRFGLGYLPERTALPAYARVESFLRGIAALCERDARAAADRALQWGGVEGLGGARIGSLSYGLQRRVALAAVELGRPRLLLLDEPTLGLDPIAVRDLRQRIARWRDEGRWLVISSHHLDELQRMADEVLLLWGGRLRAALPPDEVRRMGPGDLDAWFSRACGGDS